MTKQIYIASSLKVARKDFQKTNKTNKTIQYYCTTQRVPFTYFTQINPITHPPIPPLLSNYHPQPQLLVTSSKPFWPELISVV